MVRRILILVTLLLAVSDALAESPVVGVVRDGRGEPIAGATVEVRAGGSVVRATTDADGRFIIDPAPGAGGTVRVEAAGFAAAERPWSPEARVEVVLEPAPLSEQITVTADRAPRPLGDTAASVVVLSRDDLDRTAAVTLDGALKAVPGFQLFRRTDSRAANPTAQGASLRGVAPSGASRAAVLVDGVPLTDPFGGWVYWSRVPRASIDRVEVARGGASSLYGTDALGGVVQVLTRPLASRPWLSLDASAGAQGTAELSASGGASAGPWRGSLMGEVFHTDGYVLVDEDERGPVDTEAASEHWTLGGLLERRLGERGRLYVRGSLFEERRENGTPLQTNATHVRDVVVGTEWSGDTIGAVTLRLYAGAQRYDQTFTAVAEDRASEALTRTQFVPAQQTGLAATWVRAFADRVTVVAGVDAREVRGASDEVGYFGGRATSASGSGGRQRTVAAFGEGIVRLGDRVTLAGGLRFDRWRDADAYSGTRRLDDRTETAASPRASLVVRATPALTLRAAAYRSFRAPTLNELYRGFRVGDVVTLANESLRAERLTGGEAGAALELLDGRVAARATGFWSEMTRPVANVTLSVTPELITRRRENLGRTRSRGVELDASARLGRVELGGGYTFVDATVLAFEANPALVGNRIPQVPRHVASVRAVWAAPWRISVAGLGRVSSDQFDDDLNRLALDAYGTVDVVVARPVGRGVELYLAAENIFDRRYEVGKTPVTTIGPPASVRVGIRVR